MRVARQVRNDMEYGAREVTDTELSDLADAAAKVVAAARTFIDATRRGE